MSTDAIYTFLDKSLDKIIAELIVLKTSLVQRDGEQTENGGQITAEEYDKVSEQIQKIHLELLRIKFESAAKRGLD